MSTAFWLAATLFLGVASGGAAVACPATNAPTPSISAPCSAVLPSTAPNAATTSAAAASALALDTFFRSSLTLAKNQLDGQEAKPSSTRSVRDVSSAAVLAMPGDITPVTMKGNTCGNTLTCTHYASCTNLITVCSNTCGMYPTCNGQNSYCFSTCTNYPTCVSGSNACLPTMNSPWTTCHGNGQVTAQCNQTCRTYPTCYSTCNGGPVNTCSGLTPTCNSATCAGAPTCNGGATCRSTGGSCIVTTAPQSSCQGNPPSYCAQTCTGYSTCVGFGGTCNQSGLLAAGEPMSMPFSASVLAMGSLLVRRRRKNAADA